MADGAEIRDGWAIYSYKAGELAGDRGMMSLCHQCANGEDAEEWVTSGELDEGPVGLEAEEEQR